MVRFLRRCVVPALVLGTLAMGPEDARADCGSSQRLSVANADCLVGGHHNSGNWVNRKGKAWARVADQCAPALWKFPKKYRAVWAKVDRKSAGDWTWKLTTTIIREKSGSATIRGVYCCSDKGLCNLSDAINTESCTKDFKENVDGADGCTVDSASASARTCTVTATCNDNDGEPQTSTVSEYFGGWSDWEVDNGRVRESS